MNIFQTTLIVFGGFRNFSLQCTIIIYRYLLPDTQVRIGTLSDYSKENNSLHCICEFSEKF